MWCEDWNNVNIIVLRGRIGNKTGVHIYQQLAVTLEFFLTWYSEFTQRLSCGADCVYEWFLVPNLPMFFNHTEVRHSNSYLKKPHYSCLRVTFFHYKTFTEPYFSNMFLVARALRTGLSQTEQNRWYLLFRIKCLRKRWAGWTKLHEAIPSFIENKISEAIRDNFLKMLGPNCRHALNQLSYVLQMRIY